MKKVANGEIDKRSMSKILYDRLFLPYLTLLISFIVGVVIYRYSNHQCRQYSHQYVKKHTIHFYKSAQKN